METHKITIFLDNIYFIFTLLITKYKTNNMKKIILFIFSFIICFSCKNTENSNEDSEQQTATETSSEKAEFAIIIHGGAGTILKKNMTV